jgi:tetratricopeptide (TPR) repeat protein
MKINIQGILKHLIFAIFFILIPISVYTQDNPNKKEALIYYNYGLSSDQLGNYDRAIENFLNNFNTDYRYMIMDMLKRGGYYPQEGLEKEKMREIWRKISWT